MESELLIENYCTIAIYLDDDTWKPWILVCKTFIAMVPYKTRPLSGLFIGHIPKSVLKKRTDLSDKQKAEKYDLNRSIKYMTRPYHSLGKSTGDHNFLHYKIASMETKTKNFKALFDGWVHIEMQKLQPDMNPTYIRSAGVSSEPDNEYITVNVNFYEQRITVKSITRNMEMVGKRYDTSLIHVSAPYEIDIYKHDDVDEIDDITDDEIVNLYNRTSPSHPYYDIIVREYKERMRDSRKFNNDDDAKWGCNSEFNYECYKK